MCTWAYCSVTSWKPDNTWSNNDVIMIMMYKLSVPCLATISLSCIDYHSTLLSLPPVNAGGNLSTVTSPYLTPVRVPKKQGIIATHNNKIRPASSSVNTTGVLQFFFFFMTSSFAGTSKERSTNKRTKDWTNWNNFVFFSILFMIVPCDNCFGNGRQFWKCL